MFKRRNCTEDELIIAMNLYCKLSFGQFHKNNSLLIKVAEKLQRSPNSLSIKLCNLASFDPHHQERGIKGLKNASKADQEIWEKFNNNWTEMIILSEQKFLQLNIEEDINEKLVEEINQQNEEESDIKETEVEAKVKVRKGQNIFRKIVLSAYNNRCCITENPIPNLLIASHILPWKINIKHRLNPHNGLCLARTQDVAFDQGLITLDDNYCLIISSFLKKFLPNRALEYNFLQYENKTINLPEKFYPSLDFLKYHRENIFKK